MAFTRREFLTAAGAASDCGRPATARSFAQGKDIKLGSVLDNSGNLDIYGKPMVMATSSRSRRSMRAAVCSGARSS